MALGAYLLMVPQEGGDGGGGGSLIRNMALISFPETAKFVK